MARGDKSKYTDKQKRQAEHIAEGYQDKGLKGKTAKARAWATVNKESGGGKKGGSGMKGRLTLKKGGKASGKSESGERGMSAKKSWRGRKKAA
jgi:hypothetical protein